MNPKQLRANKLIGSLLIITLMVFVLGLFSTAAALLKGKWVIAFGTLGVTVLLGVLAGMLRLWMRAAAIAWQGSDDDESDDLTLGEVLAKARLHDDRERNDDLESWLAQLAPKKRRKLLVSKLKDSTLAAEALRIATGIGMATYIAQRATRQGILSMVHEALREQYSNPLWAHAFEGDELTEQMLLAEPECEEDLAEQLRHFLADTKEEHRVSVLAATLPEDLLAGSIVAYADPEQLIALLERNNVN
jgi:hypothetical protein